MVIYKVYGPPVPWAAPQRCKDSFYNPKHKEKLQVIWQLKSQVNHPPFFGPVRLDVNFYMPIPKSTSGIKRRQMLSGMIHHIGKPDRSNLLKFIEDCLQAAEAISNDSIIVAGETQKIYGEEPQTIIRLTEISLINQGMNDAS